MIQVSYDENRCLEFVRLWNERGACGSFTEEGLRRIIRLASSTCMKESLEYRSINEVFNILIGALVLAASEREVYESALSLSGCAA